MKIHFKKKIIIITSIAFLLCVITSIFAVWKLNKYYLELNVSEKTITIEYGVDEMPEITALCKGSLINRKGTPVKTTMKGELDLQKLGEYQVTFVSKYKDMTISEKRTIIIKDTIAPDIQLISSPDYYTNPSMAYVEEGFSATDNYDGDITSQVVSIEKDGIVTYTVSDSSGNTATAERKIIYKDVIAPVITLTNGPSISLNRGKDLLIRDLKLLMNVTEISQLPLRWKEPSMVIHMEHIL